MNVLARKFETALLAWRSGRFTGSKRPAGLTVDAAVFNIEKGIKLYIETLVELNEPVPQPDNDDFYVTTKRIELDSPLKV